MAWTSSRTILCAGALAILDGRRESADALVEIDLPESATGLSSPIKAAGCHGNVCQQIVLCVWSGLHAQNVEAKRGSFGVHTQTLDTEPEMLHLASEIIFA